MSLREHDAPPQLSSVASVKRFPSSFDAHTHGISTLVVVIVALVVVLTGVAAQAGRSLFFATVSVGLSAFFAFLFALSPNGVEVGDDVVYIRRRWGGVPRHLAALTSARRIAIHELQSSIRLVSVGGVFGWYGTFQSPTLGEFKMFATRLDRLVLMDFQGERIVVSVDEPDALLALLRVQTG
ncbi:MAG: hypothetical protein KatS3mg053_1504 [Candidatus Roseilinea sp.]|nr:MAG: hypothetical protein KatS3mg053_1504 [Candidatus Roseilinea sp.]